MEKYTVHENLSYWETREMRMESQKMEFSIVPSKPGQIPA